MSFLSFIVSILPVILIGLYIYKKDREKESSKLLFKLFSVGILSCFPVLIVGSLLDMFFPELDSMNIGQLVLYVFIVIALVEELCKWLFLYKISYNDEEFDTSYDMIVYASFVALGFACFENILYVSSAGILTGLLRSVSAVPGHVCDGILMGSYLAIAKVHHVNGNYALSRKYKILSVVIPTISHGIYDLCLFLDNFLFTIIFAIFVFSLFSVCIKKIKDVSSNDLKFKYKNKYCTTCGHCVNSRYCPRCGKENE